MSKKFLFTVFIVITSSPLFSQKKTYNQLLNSLISSIEFVDIKPISKINLERYSIQEYQDYLVGSGKRKIDSITLKQLITNAKRIDTTSWNDSELHNAIIVRNTNEAVSMAYVKNKFANHKKELPNIQSLVVKFNLNREKVIYLYSRPVFDDTGKFAIVEYIYPHRGHGILLFHFNDNKWVKIGHIAKWAY